MEFSLAWKNPITGKLKREPRVSFHYLQSHFAGTLYYDRFIEWAKQAKQGDLIELGCSKVTLVKGVK